jgi:hypothetical protein
VPVCGRSDSIGAAYGIDPFRALAAHFDHSAGGRPLRENATAMMGNDYRLTCDWISPFLMTPRSADPQKAVRAKNSDHLV